MADPRTDPAAGPVGPPTGWAVPAFPHEPVDEPTLTEVPDALLTAVRQGPLRTVQAPTRWLKGAVHDADGRLLLASQKIGGLGGNEGAMADPRRTRVPDDARVLTGRWLYGGHWIMHFGHFVTETVTTLWPEALDVDGLVFHAYFGGFGGFEPWQREVLGLTGYGHLPLEVVHKAPLRVEQLLLPSRSVVVNGWAHAGARDVWQRIAAAVGAPTRLVPDGPRVFLSRTAFNAGKRDAGRPVRTSEGRDRRLDEVFAAAGFAVVAPESLSIPDQVRLVAGASVVAGSAGTALHLTAFAPPGVRVIELGDQRSPRVQVPQQLVIDCLLEHPSAFVPFEVPARRLPRVLHDLGL